MPVSRFTRLPVIVGFGGYNAAGRSSGHMAYQRMIFESLGAGASDQVVNALKSMMTGPTESHRSDAVQLTRQQVLDGTLVRRIESTFFPVGRVPFNRSALAQASERHPLRITMLSKDRPDPLPFGWTVLGSSDGKSEIEIWKPQELNLPMAQEMPVQAAGQLPTGFDPGAYYRSTHHPRGLQLSIMAASDAVESLGFKWSSLLCHLGPDEIGVYSSSVMSQLDQTGLGGMMQSRNRGQRVTSKQLALGLNTMPADFVNAYVLGSLGVTGGVTGACATFLYNLRAAVEDIQSGRRRAVLVGSTEAPIIPEVIDGYAAMGALATDEELRKLDGTQEADYRRASRPFGRNCGFTLAESGQYIVLMDDTLALQLGAEIYGAVPAVYVNADGFKKSISAPGPGNCITMGKSVALARNLLGERAVQQQSFVQAHGSSTPQNRVTESRIFDTIAREFGIERWPVAAVKSYLGHSLGPASGDQMMSSLGVFAYGVLPGIKTIDAIAEDVIGDRLLLSNRDQELGVDSASVAFLNSKGFGGNNATATVLSPATVKRALVKRHGDRVWQAYEAANSVVKQNAEDYQAAAAKGQLAAIYHFGEDLLDHDAIGFSDKGMTVPGYGNPVSFTETEGYDDLI